jgi:hypothetical protein
MNQRTRLADVKIIRKSLRSLAKIVRSASVSPALQDNLWKTMTDILIEYGVVDWPERR